METTNTNLPEIERALEATKTNDELMRPLVDEIVEKLVSEIDNNESFLDSKLALSVLAKSTTSLSQMYCNSKEHFEDELKEVNQVVTENVMASLGAYANEDQTNNKVIYNSNEIDYENFSIRRLAMLSASIIEYTLWRLTLNDAIELELEKQKEISKTVTESEQAE